MRFSTWKPSTAVTINYGHPLAAGISACYLFNEGGGPIRDLVAGGPMAFQAAGARGKFNFGDGLDCRGSEAGALVTAPTRLRGLCPKAIVWRGQIHSSPAAFAILAGVGYDVGVISPFSSYHLGINTGSDGYRLGWNSGGFTNDSGSVTALVPFNGSERQLVAQWRDPGGFNNGVVETWENRVKVDSDSGIGVTLTYSATPPLTIGTDTFSLARDSKSVCRHLYIYNRFFSANEVEWLLDEPYAFIRPVRQNTKYFVNGNGLSITKGDSLNFLADGVALTGGDPDFHIQLGDSLHQSDSARIVEGLLQTFADTVNNWADAVTRIIGFPIAVGDTNQANWADAIVLNIPVLIVAADTMNFMVDAVRLSTRLRVALGDNFVMSDALRMRFVYLLRTADIITTLADAAHLDLPARPAFADDMNNLSDAVSVALSVLVTRTAADTLAMSDAVTVQLDTPYNPTTDILRIRRYLNDTE